jgi:hypothetical protein
MWRLPRNVSVPEANAKDIPGTARTVRRVEITVERQVCSVEVHGAVTLQYGSPCPVCGQTLIEPECKPSPELPAGDPTPANVSTK